jgi:ribosomal protein S18
VRVLSRIYEEIQNRVPHMKIETMQYKNLEPLSNLISEKKCGRQ